MLALADTGATLTVMPGALLHRLGVQRLRRVSAVLAEVGFAVTGYDTNHDFVSRVNATGDAGFREEGLDELLATHLHKSLTLTSSPPADQDVYIITVGTPLEPGTQRPGLDRIRVAVQRIAPGFGPDPLIILRSTVSIGTTRSVVLPEIRRHAQRFGLAFCPERTIEGKAIPEMRSLPQIVGGLDDESADRAEALFRLITPKIVRVSSLEAAEMIKLINNTYRDLTFAFANEVALILIDSLKKIDFKPRVIEEARKINQAMPDHVAARIIEELRRLRRAPARARVLITGFAFKGRPATEDVRGSAAIPLMRRLQSSRVEVWGHGFVTPEKVIAALGARACTLEDGFEDADGVIIMNNHPGYRSANIPALARRLRAPAFLFDSWSLFDIRDSREVAGFRYAPLGAPFCGVLKPGETH
jgi:UDP-N-acetyl-D-mannosaminuronic acid dehydrogenase